MRVSNEPAARPKLITTARAKNMTRFRPVLITTITTVLGLVSLMIPPDAMFFALAVVISFGLAAGTLLTLIVVPVL